VSRSIPLPNLRPRYLDGGWVASTTPRPLYPRGKPGTHCTGGWVGPPGPVCKDAENLDPRTIQPVASRYTDCAIPVKVKVKYPRYRPTQRPPLTPGISWYLFLESESTPGTCICRMVRKKITSDTTGDRYWVLPTSSVEP
jgi:hypothetical protein